jgi:hypothetical protein
MRNKIMLLAAIVFSMALGAAAQTANVEVSNAKFVWNIYGSYGIGQFSSSPAGSRAGLSFDPLQEISASFRNTGSKTIRKISWEFISHKTDKPNEIDYVYSVESKELIAPGETVRLSKTGAFWARGVNVQARVFRVEYTDGSVWQGTKTKK